MAAHFAAHGPISDLAELISATSRGTVRAACERGLITRMGSGVYVVSEFAEPRLGVACPSPTWVKRDGTERGATGDGPSAESRAAEEARLVTALFAVARGQRACLTLRCAAIAHGWPILVNPECVELAVPAGRRAPRPGGRPTARTVRDLSSEELREACTSPLATVIDSARGLPFGEALAIADSALRSGKVGLLELRAAGDLARGPGAPRVRRVARSADGARANPFESAVAAVLDGIEGLNLTPQYVIQNRNEHFYARVDAADPRLRIVVEADSYEFHGGREAFRTDRRRYVGLTALGWLVVPVTMPMVMDTPAWLRAQVSRVIALREFQIGLEERAARERSVGSRTTRLAEVGATRTTQVRASARSRRSRKAVADLP